MAAKDKKVDIQALAKSLQSTKKNKSSKKQSGKEPLMPEFKAEQPTPAKHRVRCTCGTYTLVEPNQSAYYCSYCEVSKLVGEEEVDFVDTISRTHFLQGG